MTYLDKNNIVFFDAECVLCGNFLKLLLKIDKGKVLHFASLQSDFSKEILPEEFVAAADYKTVAFYKDGELYYFSEAVLKIFALMGYPYKLLNVFRILPKSWRDHLYMKISKNRYSWFGKSDQCILPTPEMEERFMHKINMV